MLHRSMNLISKLIDKIDLLNLHFYITKQKQDGRDRFIPKHNMKIPFLRTKMHHACATTLV